MTETEWETATWVASAVALATLLAVPAICWLLLHGRALAARLAAATAAARRTEAAARLGDQDDLVQTLVIATYALQLGDHDRARDAVDDALRRSRVTLDQLLAEAGRCALTTPSPDATTASQATSRVPEHAPPSAAAHLSSDAVPAGALPAGTVSTGADEPPARGRPSRPVALYRGITRHRAA